MIQIFNRFLNFYRRILDSIAFYPSLISVAFFLGALLSLWLEDLGITDWMVKNVPRLVINNADTARVLMSTFIGGLLSLTVFSFSMVMITLNQAASSFTPRLLPGLISSVRHQVVLGFYIGTILYSLMILISILPDENAYTLPGFSIFLAIVFTIVCLALFVYFIHFISQDIQVNTVLKRLMDNTSRRLIELDKEKQRHRKNKEPASKDWQVIPSNRSGYFRGIAIENLLNVAKENNTEIEILCANGTYLLEGLPLLKSQKELDEKAQNDVLSCIRFEGEESVMDNYAVGFKQITEIAMKAMSPGINDPGTALNAIDYLTNLFALRMKINDDEFYLDEDDQIRVYVTAVDFDGLLYSTLSQLRLYSKEDPSVMRQLLFMLQKLEQCPAEKDSYYEDISKQRDLLGLDIKSHIKNKEDLGRLNQLME